MSIIDGNVNIVSSRNLNNVWILADTHFSHLNIIAYTRRPFFKHGYTMDDLNGFLASTTGRPDKDKLLEIVDLNLHDETLIQNWNLNIKQKDTVYHLGDFSLFNQERILKRLNGDKILIKGNHDKGIESFSKYFNCIFKEPPVNRGTSINGVKVILNHYPMLSWNAKFHNRIHFFGHVHSSPLKPFIPSRNSYDVGVDNNGYSPILFEDAMNKAINNKNYLKFDKEGEDGFEDVENSFDLLELS